MIEELSDSEAEHPIKYPKHPKLNKIESSVEDMQDDIYRIESKIDRLKESRRHIAAYCSSVHVFCTTKDYSWHFPMQSLSLCSPGFDVKMLQSDYLSMCQ